MIEKLLNNSWNYPGILFPDICRNPVISVNHLLISVHHLLISILLINKLVKIVNHYFNITGMYLLVIVNPNLSYQQVMVLNHYLSCQSVTGY